MELLRLENITKTYHLGTIDVPVLVAFLCPSLAARWWC